MGKFWDFVWKAVVAGVLGSAAWELLIKPYSSLILDLLLWVVTLGEQRLIDSLYAMVSNGPRDLSSDYVFAVVLSIAVNISIVICVRYLNIHRARPPAQTKNLNHKRYWTLYSIMVSMLFIMLLLITSEFISNAYVLGAATFIQKAIAIVEPDISAHDALVLRSRAASIDSRKSFIALFDDLHKTSESTGHKLPAFKPF